ncbi:MAG: hypothetical protein WCA15_14265 [Candidatus Acidiferrales bacterium]
MRFAKVEQCLHVSLRGAGGEAEGLAQEDGGIVAFSCAEKQDAEVRGCIRMRGIEQEGATQRAFGDAQLDYCPVVPEVRGFTLQERSGKHGGSLDDLAVEKKACGVGKLGAGRRFGGGDGDVGGHRRKLPDL